MPEAKIVFDFQNYWHAGSGQGEGMQRDAVVIKTAHDLPYLPGKTVKGLLREAFQTAEESGLISAETEKLFGTPIAKEDRYKTESGILRFSDARLPGESIWAGEASKMKRCFFDEFASTAIDDSGQAEDKSLRIIEVTVPLSLEATVEADLPSNEWISLIGQMNKIVGLLRYIGSHRHRGLGKVKITVKEVGA